MNTTKIKLRTKGNNDIIDITPQLEEIVRREKLGDGVLFLSVIGSTTAITTMEFEPGLEADVKAMCEKLFPYRKDYKHNATWSDDNGHSHLRSTFLKTSMFVTVTEGAMDLGQWQQVVLMDFDTRERGRTVVVKILKGC